MALDQTQFNLLKDKLKQKTTSPQSGVDPTTFLKLKEQLKNQNYNSVKASVEAGANSLNLPKPVNWFTSGARKMGALVGQAIGANEAGTSLNNDVEQAIKVQGDLMKRIKIAKSEGRDASRLEHALENHNKLIASLVPNYQENNPLTKLSGTEAAKMTAGAALQTLGEATMGGTLKGVKGIGLVKNIPKTKAEAEAAKAAFKALPLAQRIGQTWKTAGKAALAVAPVAYTSEVGQNLYDNKKGTDIVKPGLGTALAIGIPAAGAVAGTIRETARTLLPKVASNLSGVPEKAYTQAGSESQIGKVSPESVLDDTRTKAALFNKKVQDTFGAGKESIIQEFSGKRIGMTKAEATKLTKIADEFGFADKLPQNLQVMSPKEVIDTLTEINSVGPVKAFDTPSVKNYKLALAELKNSLKSQAVENFGGKGGSFDTLYADYSKSQKVLNDVQKIIGKVGVQQGTMPLNPVQKATAQSRLMSIFKEDKKAYIDAVKALEDASGEKILDKVAAAHLSDWIPKGLKGGSAGVFGLASDLLQLATFPLSSPRLGKTLINAVTDFPGNIADKLLNASPSVRRAIVYAVEHENMSFNDAVKKLFAGGNAGFIDKGAVAKIGATTAAIPAAIAGYKKLEKANTIVYNKASETDKSYTVRYQSGKDSVPVKVSDSDLNLLKDVLFSELSDTGTIEDKKKEAAQIISTAFNRILEHKGKNKQVTLSDVLTAPNQYKGYNSPLYQKVKNNSIDTKNPMVQERISAINEVLDMIKTGKFKDLLNKGVYYSHKTIKGKRILVPGTGTLYANK